jgi:hypothetical protein
MAERGILLALNGLLKGINSGLEARDKKEKESKVLALKQQEIDLKRDRQTQIDEMYDRKIEDQEARTGILAEKLGIERGKAATATRDKTNDDVARLTNSKNSLYETMGKENKEIGELTRKLSRMQKAKQDVKDPETYKQMQDLLNQRTKARDQMQLDLDNTENQLRDIQRRVKPQKTSRASKLESFKAIKTFQEIESLNDPDDILNLLDAEDFSITNANEREELKQAALEKIRAIRGGKKVAGGSFYQGESISPDSSFRERAPGESLPEYVDKDTDYETDKAESKKKLNTRRA